MINTLIDFLFPDKPKKGLKNIPLDALSKAQLRLIANECVDICSELFGRRRSLPTISIRNRQHETSTTYGWYEYQHNKITLFYGVCKNLQSFVSTIVHEYTHYTQPVAQKYYKLLEKHGYNNHPFEIEAFENEKKYSEYVFKEVVKRLSL